jgi:hypothetical protein
MAEQTQTVTKSANAVQTQATPKPTANMQATQQSAENQTVPVEEVSVWKKWWFWLIVVLIIAVLGAIAYYLF